jgi:hypothetical protein
VSELTSQSSTSAPPTPRWFSAFPQHGIWTAVGLSRAQFFGILLASTALFVLIGGPLWTHLRGAHFGRILWSYATIPPLVAAALAYNRRLEPRLVLGASGVLAFAKWILTAALTLVLGLL